MTFAPPAPVVSTVVAPCNVMPLVMVSFDNQLTWPAGIITVSPSAARATAELTSARDAVLALMVAPASAWLGTIKNKLEASAAQPQLDTNRVLIGDI